MNYQVFARKWRPKKFSEIIGQKHIIQVITHSFNLNKIHHAYLLSGMRGIGKTTIGRLFVKGLNCKKNGPTVNICGECDNCKSIESGCFIDLIEIDAASKTKVEDTREILDNIYYFPSYGKYKVYLIDEAHMLSKHSFNALLKTLEEPPEHVKFILITTEYNKLPETILSRCMQFHLKPISVSEMLTKLTYICNQENIPTDEHALQLIVHASQGSMRDALNLLEKAVLSDKNSITKDNINNMLGIISIEHSLFFIESLINNDIHGIMCKINSLSELGVDWNYLYNDILTILQRIAVYQFSFNSFQRDICIDNQERYLDQQIWDLGNRIAPESIQLYYQIFLLGKKELPYAPSYRMGIEMTMLRAIAFYPIDVNLKKCCQNKNIESNNSTQHTSKENMIYSTHYRNKSCSLINKQSIKDTLSYTSNAQVEDSEVYNNINIDNNNISINYPKTVRNDSVRTIISNVQNSNSTTPYQTISNITSTILNVQSKLIGYKQNKSSKSLKLDTNIKSQEEISEKIFKKFFNINVEDEIKKKKKTKNLDPKIIQNLVVNIYDIFCDYSKNNTKFTVNSFIQSTLRKVIHSNVWLLQIYQCCLTKLTKKILLNSWKETIDSNTVCLHVRDNKQFLYLKKMHNIIQTEFNNNTGVSITLQIVKNDKFSQKTPIEYILSTYIQEIFYLQKQLLGDENIKTLKLLFDVKFDVTNIEIF